MPATDLGWQQSEASPIFQVFGTKRKSEGPDSSYCFNPKRRCTHVESMEEEEDMVAMVTQPAGIPSDDRTLTNNAPSPLEMAVPQQQLTDSRVPPLPHLIMDHFPNNSAQEYNNNNNQLELQAQQQPSLFMDLESEVYTTASLPLNPQTDAEYEAACNMMSAMEGEGAPDPEQYRVAPQPATPQNGTGTREPAYCDQYCVGGDRSPASGRVRCFCKPSWEGLMDMRPYISDYY